MVTETQLFETPETQLFESPETQLFESPDLTALDYCLWGWIKCDVYKRRVDTRDELFAHILDAAACIKEPERTTQTNKARSSHTNC
jgi:hypothetical protein